MKRYILVLFFASALIFSCSKGDDNNETETEQNAIVGSWRATEFQAPDSNNPDVNFGAEILDELTAEECYILTFAFNADSTVVVENAVNNIVPNSTPTGVSVDCPTQKDVESGTYTYDGSVLNLQDEDGVSQMIRVTIEGDIMSVDATDLDVENLNAEGNLIFEKF